MKNVYGYIRVSTAKQGEGVSLDVQKDAITRYASQYKLNIVKWFEEKETAAKLGRPLFNEMMKNLRTGKAHGVIIHKIDRGARNLKDWADIGNLIDKGVEVHFAHESLDLQARGGRLSADIQAVIAADYVRNLRQETIKGLYGRLEQGIWPFHAPAGYLNTGKGKYKILCPEQAPIVKKVFELYATQKYNLRELLPIAQKLGLKSNRGAQVTFQGLSSILNNPFYIGLLKAKGGTYQGGHEPLISPTLFKKVQQILKGKTNQKVKKHEFVFRKLIQCSGCGYKLIPETQKGHIYYRCHTKECPTKAIREQAIDNKLIHLFAGTQLLPEEIEVLESFMKEYEKEETNKQLDLLTSVKFQKTALEKKLERLTDCYLEESLDKQTYEKRKQDLFFELKSKEYDERILGGNLTEVFRKSREFLERSKSLTNSYKTEILEEKKDLVEIVTSNLQVHGKKLMISMRSPFHEIAERRELQLCALTRSTPRKMQREFDLTEQSTPKVIQPFTHEQLKEVFQLILATVSNLPDSTNESHEL